MKKVLIVDDFKNSLFVTGFTIEKSGYSIFKAESGKAALDILGKNPDIDLIITDFNMPEMNGLQFIQQAKLLLRNQHIAIFVLSTETKQEIKNEAYSLGVTLWIQKPFKTEQLVNYIKRAIG